MIVTDSDVLSIAPRCIWLAAEPVFAHGAITGDHAAELWRAVIKDELRARNPQVAVRLLEPLRHRNAHTNVDCPGLVLEYDDRVQPPRVLLKFLGRAVEFAPAVLLAMRTALQAGVGEARRIVGDIGALHAWGDGGWQPIGMPVVAQDLERWRAEPSALADTQASKDIIGPGPGRHVDAVRIVMRSRLNWRRNGELVTHPPQMVDWVHLVADRIERVGLAWADDPSAVRRRLDVARLLEMAQAIRLTECRWKMKHRSQRGEYPSHGMAGWLRYEGAVAPALMRWLHAGSFLHVGQQTAIGLGGYWVECA